MKEGRKGWREGVRKKGGMKEGEERAGVVRM